MRQRRSRSAGCGGVEVAWSVPTGTHVTGCVLDHKTGFQRWLPALQDTLMTIAEGKLFETESGDAGDGSTRRRSTCAHTHTCTHTCSSTCTHTHTLTTFNVLTCRHSVIHENLQIRNHKCFFPILFLDQKPIFSS